jgi:hypothetical protein
MSQKKTVVSVARNSFASNFSRLGLSAIRSDGGKALRQAVIAETKSEMGVSDASAASAYNTVKKENIAMNVIPEDLLGRKAKAAASSEE